MLASCQPHNRATTIRGAGAYEQLAAVGGVGSKAGSSVLGRAVKTLCVAWLCDEEDCGWLQVSPEEFKEMWDMEIETDQPPWDPPEILQVQPSPEWPPEVQRHYDRFQWLLFLLRKAHMQPSPAAPAKAVLDAGKHCSCPHCFLPQLLARLLLVPFFTCQPVGSGIRTAEALWCKLLHSWSAAG